ncbi:MAG: glycoside hydrolase family 18 protein [Terracidiphilus sp.]
MIVGYVFAQGVPLQPGQVDAHAMTRINYAFAVIKDSRVVLPEADDGTNLAQLTALRQQNPSLAILLSIGGWLGSGGFSDAALNAQSRAVFADSAVTLVTKYGLDGIDIDWEYPGLPGEGNRHRKEDKRNFTLLLKQMREKMTEVSKPMHRHLYLTIAAGASAEFLDHTEMAQAAHFLDTVNLMTYDYYEAGSDKITGNHAPLFTNPQDPKQESADASVRAFETAGVPAGKIILGVPFYGRMWGDVADVNHGLFQPGRPIPNSYAPYNVIVATMLSQGYERNWDAVSKVPNLFNRQKQIFVSYEDPESLTSKCEYVTAHKLGGVMFWSYFNDSSGDLLATINRVLRPASSAAGANDPR